MLASWNVNSLRVRESHVIEWLRQHNVDVLGLQETKTVDDQFPDSVFKTMGYHVYFTGQKTYNGVALLAKHEPIEVLTSMPTLPEDDQKRFIAAAWPNTWVVNVYVPNGSEVGSDKYHYKLAWLDALIHWVKSVQQKGCQIVIMGDFNIAPRPIDTYDPEVWSDGILVSPPERERLERLLALGFIDTFRAHQGDVTGHYSWWDYRQARFRRGQGLRIDLLLATQGLSLQDAWIDESPRALDRPSDHAPIGAAFAGDMWS